MSVKEAKRVHTMEQVVAGTISVRQAAEMLSLSERQVKRLKGGIKREGLQPSRSVRTFSLADLRNTDLQPSFRISRHATYRFR